MLKQEKVGDGTLGEFSAVRFFSALRNAGCNPLIRDGAICSELGRASMVRRWAAAHDPDGAIQMEYARAMWATRAPGMRMIELG